MKDKILYYPAIKLPNNEWSIKSTLYWDEIGIIIPYEYIENPQLLGKRMQEMVEVELVKQYISNDFGEEQYKVSKAINSAILNDSFNLKERQKSFREGDFWKIHKQKFRDELFELIVDLQLAIEQPGNYNWYNVEAKTASLMMTNLAASIAYQINYSPATDNAEYIKKDDHLGLINQNTSSIRSQILENVMPYPKNADFIDLIKFKDRYHEQLRDFRREIERVTLTICSIMDEETKNQLLQIEIETINDRKNELVARLNENKLGKIAFGTFKGMIVDGAIAVVTGDVISPAASFLGGINEIIKQHKGNPIKDDDLAYIALMEQRLKQRRL